MALVDIRWVPRQASAGIEVTFALAEEGEAGGNVSVAAPAPQVHDLVLQAVGRTPNGKKIAAEKAGVAVTDRGFINVDIQMRTNVSLGESIGMAAEVAHGSCTDLPPVRK
jgi:hypothetical protein